jgi:hypothetical protein
MLKKKQPLRWLRLAASALFAVALASTWLVSAGAASATSGSVSVFVAYADGLRGPSSQFPAPWDGSPGVTFLGCSPSASCGFDGGAVRVSNNTTATVHVDDVKVHIDTCAYDLWGASMPVTLAPGHDLVVAQTVSGGANGCTTNGTMDTSDVGPGGAKWSGVCTPDGIIPTVGVTVDGVTTTEADTGQVLNTGGVDGDACAHGNKPAGNESQMWTAIRQAFLAHGAFVIADRAAVLNGHVEFWGAQWAKNNHPSGGTAPNAFKGFADTTTTTPPACGDTWSARPGNSSKPPARPLPTDMVIIVSSKVTQKGSTISGNILHLVVVKVNPGYAPNPGHAGTGKVEGVVC